MDGELEGEVDGVAAEHRFSGVVRVDDAAQGGTRLAKAYGLAHRGHGIPNAVDTRFGIASGAKGFTALTVVSLVADGQLALDTPAREVLGDDLPLIADDVTVEHLLSHRSGIGDFLDEEAGGDVDDYVLPVPVHQLADTEDYLPVLDGHPTKFPAGERFGYCNGGYVVLALLAERVARTPFHQLVADRVCAPAGLRDTGFPRSDEPDGRTALGYLSEDGARTNVHHLPVRGTGDGGMVTTADDVHRLWEAFLAGRVVPPAWRDEMQRRRSDVPPDGSSPARRYGLGFWLDATEDRRVALEGLDAGVSFRSVHDAGRGITHTVIGNTPDGTWPVTRHLDAVLALAPG